MFKDCPGRHKTYAESLRDIEVVLEEVSRDHAPTCADGGAVSGGAVQGALPVAAVVAVVEEPLAFGLEPPAVEGPVAGVSGAGKEKRKKKEKSVTSVKNLPEAMATEEASQGTVILDTPVGGGKQWGDTEESGEMGWEVAEGKRTTKRKLNQEESDGDNKVCVIETSNSFESLENEEVGEEEVSSFEPSSVESSPLAPPSEVDSEENSVDSQLNYLSDSMVDNMKKTTMFPMDGKEDGT